MAALADGDDVQAKLRRAGTRITFLAGAFFSGGLSQIPVSPQIRTCCTLDHAHSKEEAISFPLMLFFSQTASYGRIYGWKREKA